MIKLLFVHLAMLFFFTACSNNNDVTHTPSVEGDIVDTQEWYSDSNSDLIRMDVTIPVPNESLCAPYDDTTAALRPCTLTDINNDIEPSDDYEPELYTSMSADGFNDDTNPTNSTFKIRGDYSRTLAQKSYSIRLDSKENLFLNQRKFQLAKHQSDRSRSKNKLAFDLFQDIPHITSLKLQFVNLFVDGIDYGLFTHAEAIREEYLLNRGWNEEDNLYNVVGFIFEPRDELGVNAKGEPLDAAKFNTVLEIKNGEEHSKVNEMVDAIDKTKNIDEVIEKYFNRDNYITWLAANLVLSNKDTSYHNFYLYNPKYSDTFYFLPWDYDGAWARPKYLGKNEYGVSVWWESPLHRKFLSVKKNLDDVYAMADTLREKYITDEIVQEKLDSYENTIKPFISVLPDSENNSLNTWTKDTAALVTGIEDNIALYKSVIGHPMPFEQHAEYRGGKLTFFWDESIDLEGDTVVYDLNISSTPDFTNSLISKSGLTTTKYIPEEDTTVNELTPGGYYLKVISRELNNPEHYQISFEQVKNEDNETVYGVSYFEVE